MAEPQSKSSMDPNFEFRLREFQHSSQEEYAARSKGTQVSWCRPGTWNGDPFDVEGMAVPFSREQANQDYINAVKDATNAGTTGDVVATTTMIDYLASMERAFRARFMRRPRAMAHALGRKKGHGTQQGVFIQNGVEYVRTTLQEAKVPQS